MNRRAVLLLLIPLAVACGSARDPTDPSPPQPQVTPAPTTADSPSNGAALGASGGQIAEAVVLASGQMALSAADAFGEPGFHEVLRAEAQLPAGVGGLAGLRLVLKLRDISRPSITCDSAHPLSGCATVDWSDFPGRPGVPEGGAFVNRVTLALTGGPHIFYLSESGQLIDTPEPYSPG